MNASPDSLTLILSNKHERTLVMKCILHNYEQDLHFKVEVLHFKLDLSKANLKMNIIGQSDVIFAFIRYIDQGYIK